MHSQTLSSCTKGFVELDGESPLSSPIRWREIGSIWGAWFGAQFSTMAELSATETNKFAKLGKDLAHTEKEVRDKAVETIRRWVPCYSVLIVVVRSQD